MTLEAKKRAPKISASYTESMRRTSETPFFSRSIFLTEASRFDLRFAEISRAHDLRLEFANAQARGKILLVENDERDCEGIQFTAGAAHKEASTYSSPITNKRRSALFSQVIKTVVSTSPVKGRFASDDYPGSLGVGNPPVIVD